MANRINERVYDHGLMLAEKLDERIDSSKTELESLDNIARVLLALYELKLEELNPHGDET